MAKPHWDRFEWDDQNRKGGNVQHVRDHGIEPAEAEECFFHDYVFAKDNRRFDDVYVLDGKTDRGRTVAVGSPGQGRWTRESVHRLGIEKESKAKEMKKKFSNLTKPEQTKAEADYHRMKPGELDAVISSAKSHSPDAIHLTADLVQELKTVAESEGEPEYRTMVQRWVEERLRQTSKGLPS